MQDELSLSADSMGQMVPILRVLADRTRLRIVGLLRGRELNVTSLCEVLDLAQPTVSHHLGLLREVGLVQNRREGKQVFYSLNPATVDLIGENGELALNAGSVVVQLLRGDRWNDRDKAASSSPNIAKRVGAGTTSEVAAADLVSS